MMALRLCTTDARRERARLLEVVGVNLLLRMGWDRQLEKAPSARMRTDILNDFMFVSWTKSPLT
jgi:hypothetical protein